jgi:hypothetical protein
VLALPGFSAFLGGVVAQDVIKKFGRYTPIHQWVHVDYFELLSETCPKVNLTGMVKSHSRVYHVFLSQHVNSGVLMITFNDTLIFYLISLFFAS